MAEERRLVTVLFADVVGSTAMAEELDPEDVRAHLRAFSGRLDYVYLVQAPLADRRHPEAP